jgi:hypothetical protein
MKELFDWIKNLFNKAKAEAEFVEDVVKSGKPKAEKKVAKAKKAVKKTAVKKTTAKAKKTVKKKK